MKKYECFTKPLKLFTALLMVAVAAGCNGGGAILGGGGGGAATVADTTAPRVISTGVVDGTTGLPTNRSSTATFSEAMNPATITSLSPSTAAGTTFTVCSTATQGGACVTPVAGVVSYAGNTATFKPDALLAATTWYKSTVSTAAKDLAGNALISGTVLNPWSWQTGAGPDLTPPQVTVTTPVDLASNVAVDKAVNAKFDKAMNTSTMTTANVTLTCASPCVSPVAGSVAYDVQNNIVTFIPTSNLSPGTQYTATVSNGAQDLSGNALVVPAVSGLPVPNPWTFTTAAAAVPVVPLAVNLRSAASFGIAARAGMTSTGVTVVNGDVALYPLAGCTDSTGNAGASQTCLVKTYSSPTGLSVNGSIYWAGDPYDNGGTANSVTNDLNIAWTEARNKVDTQPAIAADEMAGKTFIPGVYHNANLGLMAGGLAQLDAQNDANAIFIFKVDSTFVDSGTTLLPSEIRLINGAQARNVWFVTGLDLTIGHGTKWSGNILVGGTATILDGSTVIGRVLAGANGAGAITLTGAASPSLTSITVPQ